MKSFCLKTNNEEIINYLLNRIKKIDFINLIYTNKKFKTYQNIIIHYKENDNAKFYEILGDLIEEIVIKFYEEKIVKQILNYNYFYFDEDEKNKIWENSKKIIEKNVYIEGENIKNSVINYVKENKAMILDGFIYFRLKKYFEYLDNLVDEAVNEFVIEKEYKEFIGLLQIYVNSRNPEYNLLHLIYMNGESTILDDKKNMVSISNNICSMKFLSDITFSSNDFALNTLLNLLPKKIEIHLIDEEDEFINTIKLIFKDRTSICKDCNICKTYKLLGNKEIIHNK